MRSEADQPQPQTIEDEIAELERRLEEARGRLRPKRTFEVSAPAPASTTTAPFLQSAGKDQTPRRTSNPGHS
jgi:hypothetical protein